MQKTDIEYLDYSWNPIKMRCTMKSEGCQNCWHLRYANRHAKNPKFNLKTRLAYSGMDPVLSGKELVAPLKKKKPLRIGVQFMGDLFHENINSSYISAIYGIMAACPQHQFVILTKRSERMYGWYDLIGKRPGDELCSALMKENFEDEFACAVWNYVDGCSTWESTKNDGNPLNGTVPRWPLPNVVIGISAENQIRYDERMGAFLSCPSSYKMISLEPMLENIDLHLNGTVPRDICERYTHVSDHVDVVVCGAEQGPGKRKMELDWARSARDQCKENDVSFFFKKDSDKNHELDGIIHEEWLR